MIRTPQIILTLSPEGSLVAELPGPNGARRKVPLRDHEAVESIRRMLSAQLRSQWEIGTDGAPTARQVKHWEQHDSFADDRCPFCIAEGRTRGGKPRARPIVLAEHGGVTVRRVAAKSRKIAKERLTLEELEPLEF